MVSTTGQTLTHKVAILTGGTRGIGRNTAVNLARRGVDVLFTFHSNQTEPESLIREIEATEGKAAALRLDTGDLRAFDGFVVEVRKTLLAWGRERFDYLVNNAGISQHVDFEQMTEREFDAVVDVHFKGVDFLTQKLLPLMNDGGRIVNISSGLTRVTVPGSSAYAAAKGAVEILTRYLAKELGPLRITANVMAPGAIATDFSGGMVRDNPDLNKRVADMTALGRAGVPDNVGPMIAALLADENRWVNGQRIEVSGGMALYPSTGWRTTNCCRGTGEHVVNMYLSGAAAGGLRTSWRWRDWARYARQYGVVQGQAQPLAYIDTFWLLALCGAVMGAYGWRARREVGPMHVDDGRIDVLVVSAGFYEVGTFGEITEEHFDRTFNTNVRGVLFAVQKALPLLVKGSSVILIGSVASIKGFPSFSVYDASKAAVRSFACGWILDLKGHGIRINVLSPGHIDTPGLSELMSDDQKAEAVSHVPLGRLGTPDDMGKAAVFLASDDSAYVNGIELFADGGVAQY